MTPRVEPEGMLFRKPVSTFRDHALAAARPRSARLGQCLGDGDELSQGLAALLLYRAKRIAAGIAQRNQVLALYAQKPQLSRARLVHRYGDAGKTLRRRARWQEQHQASGR